MKKLPKVSTTVKNPTNLNKLSSTIRHSKTITNFLKFITQSNIISQKTESMKKPRF